MAILGVAAATDTVGQLHTLTAEELKDQCDVAGVGGGVTMFGSGVPDNGSGNDGDVYVRTTNMAVYKKASGTWALQVTSVLDSDSRLSDARTPTTHTHTLAAITDAGTAAALNVGTGANQVVQMTAAAKLPAVDASLATALNASALASGTVPDARFPATLPAASGVNLTALNASNLASGTVPNARFPATLPASSGVNLTALNASQLGSGVIPDARFPSVLPALSGANLTALNASNLSSGTIPTARFPATLPALNGVNLTNLNGAEIVGTIAGSQVTPDFGAQSIKATATGHRLGTPGYDDPDADMMITATSAAKKPLVIQLAPSQVQDGFQLQDTYGNILFSITATGVVTADLSNATGYRGGYIVGSISSAQLDGPLPAIDGSNLTGVKPNLSSGQGSLDSNGQTVVTPADAPTALIAGPNVSMSGSYLKTSYLGSGNWLIESSAGSADSGVAINYIAY